MNTARIEGRRKRMGGLEYWVFCPIDNPATITPEYGEPYPQPRDKPVAKCDNRCAAEKICRDYGWAAP